MTCKQFDRINYHTNYIKQNIKDTRSKSRVKSDQQHNERKVNKSFTLNPRFNL